jgi:hypothetical protein
MQARAARLRRVPADRVANPLPRERGEVVRRCGWTAALAAVVLAACGDGKVRVQPLPPLRRPSPEARAGLPEVRGAWHFAGFEFAPRDTARIREAPDLLTPPGDFNVAVQRLDSIAGTYGRDGATYPFVGETRRDGVVSLVATDADGAPQFAAMRVVRDTLWLELSSFPSLQVWPVGARAALVRTPVAQPFRRFLNGVAIVNQDSIRQDSIRRDSLRRVDSAAAALRAAQPPAPGQQPPPATQPAPAVTPSAPAQPAPAPAPPPVARPPAPRPRPRPAPPQVDSQIEPVTPPPMVDSSRRPPVLPPLLPAPPETLHIPPRQH